MPSRPTWRRPTAREVVLLASWLLVVLLVLLTLSRYTRLSDHVPRLYALEALTIWLYLPAYAVLLVAMVSRQLLLGALAFLLVITQLTLIGPDLRWWPRETGDAGEASFTLVASNLRHDNDRGRQAADTLVRLDADVLVLLEFTPEGRQALVAAGAVNRYPFRFEDPRPEAFGSAIYSKFALSAGSVLQLRNHPTVRAVAQLPTGPATIVAVHTLQPLAGLSTLRKQLAELDRLADTTEGPLIMAGDFNATRQHRAFRTLLDGRMRDAHLERGRGTARSWPVGRLLPPFALIDHVLVTDDFVVEDAGEATVPGSDHRAVRARLAKNEG